jgi:hypothetical protein
VAPHLRICRDNQWVGGWLREKGAVRWVQAGALSHRQMQAAPGAGTAALETPATLLPSTHPPTHPPSTQHPPDSAGARLPTYTFVFEGSALSST